MKCHRCHQETTSLGTAVGHLNRDDYQAKFQIYMEICSGCQVSVFGSRSPHFELVPIMVRNEARPSIPD